MGNSARHYEPVQSRTTNSKNTSILSAFLMLLTFLLFGPGCAKDETVLPTTQSDELNIESRAGVKIISRYEQENLVANVEGYDAERLDPNLVNAWGIALSPTDVFWISAEETELSVIYNADGDELRPPVTMEGGPTGQVFNSSTDFVIPDVGAARFIFATEEGTITAWRTGNVAQTVADRSASGAEYTGLAIGNDGSGNFIYAANVAEGKIDVFDGSWNYVTDKPFSDPSLPAGARPFNIQKLRDGNLWVTYVGPGGGFVNVFNTDGMFIKRFASGGTLRAPWGITETPPEFGLGNSILVGNFGDGRINVYNKNGQFKGQLGETDGEPIEIDGLWALQFTAGAFAGTADIDLYFTAGPNNEQDGLYGEIELVEEE